MKRPRLFAIAAVAGSLALGAVLFLLLRPRAGAPQAGSMTSAAPGAAAARPRPVFDVGRIAPARRSNPEASVAAAAPASSAPGGEDLGEYVDRPEECELACGTRCEKDTAGRLRCPRPCTSDNECEVGRLCEVTRPDAHARRSYRCLGSECSGPGGDGECGRGQTCVTIGRMEGAVSICARAGARKAGEPCLDDSDADHALCGKGMACKWGSCQPEVCQSDRDCPRGARCAPTGGSDHQSCVAACESDRDCPDGKYCSTLLTGLRMCVSSADNCFRTPCAGGQQCYVISATAWDFQTECARPCAADRPCGASEFCARADGTNDLLGLRARCWKQCDPTRPDACPPGSTCVGDGKGNASCVRSPHESQQKWIDDHYASAAPPP